jgi:palmitoyltransferase
MEELNNQSNNNMLNPENPSPENDLEKAHKKTKRYHGRYFIVMVLSLIIIEYYLYTFQVILPNLNDNNFINITLILFFFNIIIFMMLLAYFITMNTHPGQIPLYWGFYIGDDQYKRKRYCLICNAFKPERSHHCSICNVCILNMDHHCPWVHNCIGFYNRKYFMQLLFYLFILLIYFDSTSFYFIVENFSNKKENIKFKSSVLVISNFVLIFGFTIIIFLFFKNHVNFVLNNSTTIESLETETNEKLIKEYNEKINELNKDLNFNEDDNIKKILEEYKSKINRLEIEELEKAKFKLKKKNNWEQVFGKSIFYWFIPIFTEEGKPDGDGLIWTINESIQNLIDQKNQKI